MEFDWINPNFDLKTPVSPQEIEESFEDPFSAKLAPDHKAFTQQTRFICLGKNLSGKGIFSLYRSNGNQTRIIYARPFTSEEEHFYERKKQENL